MFWKRKRAVIDETSVNHALLAVLTDKFDRRVPGRRGRPAKTINRLSLYLSPSERAAVKKFSEDNGLSETVVCRVAVRLFLDVADK